MVKLSSWSPWREPADKHRIRYMLLGLITFIALALVSLIILKGLLPKTDGRDGLGPNSHTHSSPSAPLPESIPSSATPATGPQDLDTFKAALTTLDTASLQNMLDMGANLKPGTEEAILEELGKRNSDT